MLKKILNKISCEIFGEDSRSLSFDEREFIKAVITNRIPKLWDIKFKAETQALVLEKENWLEEFSDRQLIALAVHIKKSTQEYSWVHRRVKAILLDRINSKKEVYNYYLLYESETIKIAFHIEAESSYLVLEDNGDCYVCDVYLSDIDFEDDALSDIV